MLTALVMSMGIVMTTGQPARAAEPDRGPVLATYSGEILSEPDADGVRHVDVDATVDALVRGNINTFYYLVYGYGVANTDAYPEWDAEQVHATAAKVTAAQWEALPAFAAAAAEEGIDVRAYLVPPSESTGENGESSYAPFYWDYVEWGRQLGMVAAEHPNLRGIAIDDFGGNTTEAGAGNNWAFEFTRENVAEMRAAAQERAPWMELTPVLYYCQFHAEQNTLLPPVSIAATYRDVVDGYVGVYNGSPSCTWWSGDGTVVPNTKDASQAAAHLGFETGMVRCPDGGDCLELGVPYGTPTQEGESTSVSQEIMVDGSGSYQLSFDTNDNWIGEEPAGYHAMQVLVDDHVVWESDVVGWQDWQSHTVDLTEALEGKQRARLTLRLTETAAVANFPVLAWFDNLEATGFTLRNAGFERGLAGWLRASEGDLIAPTTVSTVSFVAMAYGAWVFPEEGPTSADYTTAVVEQIEQLYREGRVDGAVVYNMNLTGAPNGLGDEHTLPAIAEIYQGWASTQ